MSPNQIQQLIDYLEQLYQPLLKTLGGHYFIDSSVHNYTSTNGVLGVYAHMNRDIYFWMFSPNTSSMLMYNRNLDYLGLLYVNISEPLTFPIENYIQQNTFSIPLILL